MGYETGSLRYARTRDVQLAVVASGVGLVTAVTATVTGAWIELGDAASFRMKVTLATVTGTTPSYTFSLQTSSDAAVTDAARTVGTGAALTAAGSQFLTLGPIDRFVRVVLTVSGTTPSAVVTVNVAEAV